MKIAFVFPGQGSQSVGMMAGFEAHPAVRATFDEASGVLGQDLWSLVTDGAGSRSQPDREHAAGDADGRRCGVAGLAGGGRRERRRCLPDTAWASIRRWSPPAPCAFRDAVPLVRFRAQAMQEAVPAGVGAMAAILGLDAANVAAACAEAMRGPHAGQVVEPVNFNAPEQIVIAGHREAVERAIAIATERGAKRGMLLPVSAPFHSSLLKPAAARLAERLATVAVGAPGIPVLHNVDVAERPTPDGIRAALADQAANPVRWVDTIRAFVARGVTHVVECGPGRVLAGLNRRIARELTSHALTDGADLEAARQALAQ